MGREGLALVAAFVMLGGFFTRSLWVRPVAQWCWDQLPKWRLERELRFEGLQLRRYFKRGELDVLICYGNAARLDARGQRGEWTTIVDSEYSVKLEGDEPGIDDIPPIDLTGDGVPEHFAFTWSGGAHCCYKLFVFDPTSNSSPLLATIPEEHSEIADFTDADGDGLADIRILDWQFAYWGTSFAGSPAPEVILTLRGGVLKPLVRAMRRPPPSETDLIHQVAAPHSEFLTPDLWGRMLDLMYQGNEEAAWRFFDLAWPASTSSPNPEGMNDGKRIDKETFRAQFIEHLNSSKWWPLIKAEYEREASPPPAPSSLPSSPPK
jgi:hypothetical protein